MKKKLLTAFITALAVCACMLSATACGQTPSLGLDYRLINNDLEYEVIGIGDCTKENLVIPYSYNMKPITNIDDYAFFECDTIKSVSIPGSVKHIGNHAFRDCPSLESIKISVGVTSIGEFSFQSCPNLTTVSIPGSITKLPQSSFALNKSLKNVTFGEGLTTIGDDAFLGCTALESVVLPDSLKEIGYRAFGGCSSLKSIVIPRDIETINSSAFLSCQAFKSVYYKGTASDWNEIDIQYSSGSNLYTATIYCYSEERPTTSGKFWHYDRNGDIALW